MRNASKNKLVLISRKVIKINIIVSFATLHTKYQSPKDEFVTSPE
jgi:hypothetical protein